MSFKRILPSLIALLIALISWELLTNYLHILDASLYSAPSYILKSLWTEKEAIINVSWETMKASFLGWGISILLGLTIGVILHLQPLLKKAILPYAVFFQTLPIIAIAPLLVVHFGFGITTIVTASVIVAIFPVIASAIIGLEQVPKQKAELFSIYQASTVQKLWKLEIPYSLTYVFSGIKTACGLAIIGAITGEFIAGGGIGGYIDVAMTQQRVDLIFGALALLVFWGVLLNFLLSIVEKGLQLLLPFHYIRLS